MGYKKSAGLKTFNAANIIFLSVVSFCMFLPFLIILSVSFSSESSVLLNGYGLWPAEFSLEAFKFVLEAGTIGNGYIVSTFVTIVGTLIAVVVTAMAGYAVSRKNLKYRNFFALAFYFTMVFNGGLVPWYMMVSNLGLRDKIWALIIPMAFNPFNMLLIRNFFQTIPDSLVESGKLDGAGELKIFLKIILPISLPGMATITLFYMLAFWNDWWLALLYIDNYRLYPLQFLLRRIQSNIVYAMQGMNQVVKQGQIPKETVQMAMCVLTIGPIVFVYPFIQRYFVKGITIGAVKG